MLLLFLDTSRYHSHPVFEPCPSQKDCDNQRNYQALLRDHESKVEPFIGVILGPYDLAMPQPLTAITAFVVQQKAAMLQPYNVRWAWLALKGGCGGACDNTCHSM